MCDIFNQKQVLIKYEACNQRKSETNSSNTSIFFKKKQNQTTQLKNMQTT